MSLFQTINDSHIDVDIRIAIAWGAVMNTAADSTAEDQSAARCWLVYRMIDGLVDPLKFEYLVNLPIVYSGPVGLSVRWKMSQAMAEIYYHGLVSDNELALDSLLRNAVDLWKTSGFLWPPCALNFIRAAGLRYAKHRSDHAEAAAAIDDWQAAVCTLDWTAWPLRLVEMRDDLDAVWRILAMLKGHANYDYRGFDWLPRFGGHHPYHKLMAKLGAPSGFDTPAKL